MACHLSDAKSLFDPTLTYQLDPSRHSDTRMKLKLQTRFQFNTRFGRINHIDTVPVELLRYRIPVWNAF